MRQIMRTLHLPVGSENKFLQFGAFVSQIYDAIRICPNVGAENREIEMEEFSRQTLNETNINY